MIASKIKYMLKLNAGLTRNLADDSTRQSFPWRLIEVMAENHQQVRGLNLETTYKALS